MVRLYPLEQALRCPSGTTGNNTIKNEECGHTVTLLFFRNLTFTPNDNILYIEYNKLA